MTRSGFPHSDIAGSMVVCTSPALLAAYHVLHRLPVPRHPPDALSSLTENPACQTGKSSRKAFDLSPTGLGAVFWPGTDSHFSRETLPFCLVNRTVASNCQRALPVARLSHCRVTHDGGQGGATQKITQSPTGVCDPGGGSFMNRMPW